MNGIHINQRKYTLDLLESYNLTHCKPLNTPSSHTQIFVHKQSKLSTYPNIDNAYNKTPMATNKCKGIGLNYKTHKNIEAWKAN